jgi:hypothetical protein
LDLRSRPPLKGAPLSQLDDPAARKLRNRATANAAERMRVLFINGSEHLLPSSCEIYDQDLGISVFSMLANGRRQSPTIAPNGIG